MVDILKTCGLNLRHYRKAKGLTLNQLSQDIGITSSYLGYLERGQRNPSLATIAKIAEALEVEPYHLLVNFENNFDRSLHNLIIMLITRKRIDEVIFLQEVLTSYLKSIKNNDRQ
ncbi:HTH-type transcriptional regulator SinR [Pelotomaculum sp. FP]|uniref:helix-turn-helix domain-containing protein n=1 Tax=Pelotomaculum sp. FP TaxID=261474 RepID=UPI0010650734|nr:helix-turn-helix transcriptional regulator [Pelotomaculum sp. FP]TEB14781.1 HTH-type transcriptional regulator SinR [Pelotomaculum sp. FP]